MLLGADSIDDCELLLRAGRTRRLLGGWLPAPSTLGTFLRAFTFGHVRQLDRVLGEALVRAWRAGAGPGAERLVVDVDKISAITLRPALATPGRSRRSRTNPPTRRSIPSRPASVATSAIPASDTTRSSSKATRAPSNPASPSSCTTKVTS